MFCRSRVKDLPLLGGASIPTTGELDLAHQCSQRVAKLMRGVAREPPLAVECVVESMEQLIKVGTRQLSSVIVARLQEVMARSGVDRGGKVLA